MSICRRTERKEFILGQIPARNRCRTRQQTRAMAEQSARIIRLDNIINPREEMTKGSQSIESIKLASRVDSWCWNREDKSHQCLVSDDNLEVCCHPECSDSTAAIRGSRPLLQNGNFYFWEILVQEKVYGTSVMFGICTKDQILHSNDYCNLIGLGEHGWSLSHKGFSYHNGEKTQFTKQFPENQPVLVSLLFNTMNGELSYFLDGKYLGVAFSGLNKIKSELYPVVSSTAKCTKMRLTGTYICHKLHESLLNRSCYTLLRRMQDKSKLLDYLYKCKVPITLIDYLGIR